MSEVAKKVDKTPKEALAERLAVESSLTAAFNITEQLIGAVAQADNADDVLALGDQGPARAEDIAGRPIIVLDWVPRESGLAYSSAGGVNHWGLVQFLDPTTGEKGVVTLGGEFVLAQLSKLADLEAFPKALVLELKVTATGNTVQKLRAVRDVEKRLLPVEFQ